MNIGGQNEGATDGGGAVLGRAAGAGQAILRAEGAAGSAAGSGDPALQRKGATEVRIEEAHPGSPAGSGDPALQRNGAAEVRFERAHPGAAAGSGDPALQREGAGRIEAARPADAPAIAALLRESGLPHEDFAAHLRHFVVAHQDDRIVGAVGAEVCGPDALLRSLVVAPAMRRTGLGDALVRELDRRAFEWGVQRWWLLTTTAAAFFERRGFRVVSRAAVPAAIAATAEFRDLCPSVAVCLTRERRDA